MLERETQVEQRHELTVQVELALLEYGYAQQLVSCHHAAHGTHGGGVVVLQRAGKQLLQHYWFVTLRDLDLSVNNAAYWHQRIRERELASSRSGELDGLGQQVQVDFGNAESGELAKNLPIGCGNVSVLAQRVINHMEGDPLALVGCELVGLHGIVEQPRDAQVQMRDLLYDPVDVFAWGLFQQRLKQRDGYRVESLQRQVVLIVLLEQPG